VVLTSAAAAVTAVTLAVQVHPLAGALLPVVSVAVQRRHHGQSCYTITADALVQHQGRRRRALAWDTLRTPVRVERVAWQWFLHVARPGGRRLLLPIDELDAAERERLRATVEAIVWQRRRAPQAPAAPASIRTSTVP